MGADRSRQGWRSPTIAAPRPVAVGRADLGVAEAQHGSPEDARLSDSSSHHRGDGTQVADGVESALRNCVLVVVGVDPLGWQGGIDGSHLADNCPVARTEVGGRKVDHVTARGTGLGVRPPRIGHGRHAGARGGLPIDPARVGAPAPPARRHVGCDNGDEHSARHATLESSTARMACAAVRRGTGGASGVSWPGSPAARIGSASFAVVTADDDALLVQVMRVGSYPDPDRKRTATAEEVSS